MGGWDGEMGWGDGMGGWDGGMEEGESSAMSR